MKAFQDKVEWVKDSGTIESFCADQVEYSCFLCRCGKQYVGRKENAVRHCKKTGCRLENIQCTTAIKLQCGRFVTPLQIEDFLNSPPASTNDDLFDFDMVGKILLPFLPGLEKHDHTYTHLFHPLVNGCDDFISKIKQDHSDIHTPPDSGSEQTLRLILENAEQWLLHHAKTATVMVPPQIRAGLQSFEGVEVNDINQKTTYTMQSKPESILAEMKKLLMFAYRRGKFAGRGFDPKKKLAVTDFLKNLLLEKNKSYVDLPFLAEFCLMFAFRVDKQGKISMISCDTVSSVGLGLVLSSATVAMIMPDWQ